ncbi:MAG: hypothetical protein ACFFA7_16310 [Promethearchaeota archaeon]
MAENNIKTFKLNFDGTFDEISYENIKEVFTIVNILAIYIKKIKTMYIWIGRNATQALKNHISQIRVLLKDEFPDFRIIRNITFDMGTEPFEFFNNLNMEKEELYEIINYQEKTILPILEKVEGLKENSEKLMQSEQYKDAIELLKKIIKLAKKIEDDALIAEQTRLISQLTEKYENKEIVNEIDVETKEIEKEYNYLVNNNNLLEAHNLIQNFKKKYEGKYNLSLIPHTKELILKEKRIWSSEQERLTNILSKLEKELNFSLESRDVNKATDIFEEGLRFFANLIDDNIKIKWNGLEKKIQETNEKIERKKFEEKQAELKTELSKLEEKFFASIKIFEFEEMNNIFKSSSNFLSEVVDDNIKQKWQEFRDKYKNATQLLDIIEYLSKNAINALNNRSFSESLDSFTQIITHLQEYKK